MKTQFNGHASKITSIAEMHDGEHFLKYSPEFGAINEVVVSHIRPHEYPKALYVSYAHREQGNLMIVRQHELEMEWTMLFALSPKSA